MTARSGTDFPAFPTVTSRGSSKKHCRDVFVGAGLVGCVEASALRDDSIRSAWIRRMRPPGSVQPVERSQTSPTRAKLIGERQEARIGAGDSIIGENTTNQPRLRMTRLLPLLALVAVTARPARGQAPALTAADSVLVGRVLLSEDRRDSTDAVLGAAAHHSDERVRQIARRAWIRMRDPQ